MKRRSFILILIVLLPTLVAAQVNQTSPNRSIAFRNVTLIDMRSDQPQPGMTIVVSGNRISAIGKTVKIPRDSQIVEASGKFLIPGLWDMHVHIFNNSHNAGTDNHNTYFPLLLANGVTGVRDMWTDPDDLKLVREWQSEVDAGKLLAPRIAVGSSIVDGVPTHLPNMFGVSTPDEARRAVRRLKDAGAGFIKVYWRLSPEVYAAIADESKKLKIPFAGHVPFSMSAAEVSDAGQKSIEHLTGVLETCSSKEEELRKAKDLSPQELTNELWRTFDEQKCRSLFARFAKNKTWHVPTSVIHRMSAFRREADFIKDPRLRYVHADEAATWLNIPTSPQRVSFEIKKQRFDKMLETIGVMHKTGVPFLAGSDLGNPFIFAGFSLHDELELFVQAGLTPFEALQTATVNPAKYLETEKSHGTIGKGMLADLILLDANPLEDIRNTKRIAAVIVNGRYLPKETLEKMLAEVEAAVKKN